MAKKKDQNNTGKITKKPSTRTTRTTVKTIEPEVEMVDLTIKDDTEHDLPSIGLGDTIAKVTNFLGIKKCIPCEQRQNKFNKLFPWIDYQGALLQGEDAELMKRVNLNPSAVANDDVNALFALYNKLFQGKRPLKRCQCPGLLKTIVQRLNLLMPEDKEDE